MRSDPQVARAPIMVGAWPLGGLIVLATLWLVWGSSWAAMRQVFIEMPVWQFRAVSGLIAGAVLLAIAVAARGPWVVPRRQWGRLALAAFFNITLWHALVGYGLFYLGAGHAVILCYTLPIWTALLSVFVLKAPLGRRALLALVVGTGGVVALLSSDFQSLGTNPLGAVFVIGAAIGWAIGTLIFKSVDWGANLYALAAWQLILGVIPIAIVAPIVEPRFVLLDASTEGLIAAAYVIVFALIAGYLLWFRVVQVFPPMVASIGALVTPMVGVASGIIVLGEPFTWREALALALVLTAVALVIFQKKPKANRV